MVALWSMLTMVGSVATNFTTLLLARMGVGATEASASPGSLSLIGDLFPPRRRGTAVSLYYAGTACGQLITFVLGGWLLMHFGWRALFLIAGIPGLLLAVLLVTTCREPPRGRFDEPAQVKSRSRIPYADAFGYILRSPALLHGMWGNLLATGVQFSVMVWTVSFLIRVHGLSNEMAAIWVGIGIGLFQTVASLSVGPFADRFAQGNAARLALVPATFTLAAGIAGLTMTMAPTAPLAIAAMALLALMVGCFNGPGYAVLLMLSPPTMRGSILSVAKLFSILIGTGALTYFTGKVSDLLDRPDSIRYALAATFLFHFWAAFHFLMASRAASRAQQATEAA
jgi:MFS family permease